MRRFSLAEILRATNYFDESLIISMGPFGRIYKTHESVSVAICRLSFRSTSPIRFEMTIKVLLEVRHRNILSVIGYCGEEDETILVYVDVPLRTLGDNLYGDRANKYPLSWGQRLKICIGTARGLDYLHSGTNIENGVIHGNVTSETILLDENRLAKIGGFHVSTMFIYEDDEHSGLMGTVGYIDPAYLYTGIMTRNADVYSFGVVLFQVLCGRKAIDKIVLGREQEQVRNIVTVAKQYVEEGRLKQIIDPRLHGEVVLVDEFVHLAEECVDEDEEKRPKMRQVVSRLEGFLMAWELERGNVDDIEDSFYSNLAMGDSMIEQEKDGFREEVGTTQSDKKSFCKTRFRRKMSRCLKGRLGIPRLVSAALGQKKPNHTFFDIESFPHVFSLAEVLLATNRFDKALTIDRNGFGTVYKGTIFYKSKPRRVAISHRSTGSFGDTEFQREVEVQSKVRHRNVAPLIGYCTDNDERILVYEYMPNGSLDKHLYGGGYPLSWTQRLQICIDIAQGLDYLHTCTPIQKGVIHRDVKSSNIMLGDNWEAKISGLGCCRIVNANESLSHVSTRIIGTMGFIDGEYARTGILTNKSDVYSFGVVLCEVLCGRKIYDASCMDEERYLVQYFQHHHQERRSLYEIIDPRLHGQIQPNCLDAFVQILDQCLLETREERPAMAEVLARLESLMSLQQKPYVYGVEGEATTGFGSHETSSVWAPNKQESVHYSSKLEAPSVSLHYEDIEANSTPEDSPVIKRDGSSVCASGKQESMVYSSELEAPSDRDGLHHEEIEQLSNSVSNPRSCSVTSVTHTPSVKNTKKKKAQRFLSSVTNFLSGMKLRKSKQKPSTSESLWQKEHRIDKQYRSTQFEAGSEHIDQIMHEEIVSEAKDEEYLSPSQEKFSADVIQLDYAGEANVLNRKKDFLQLIMSYPMKSEAEIDFQTLNRQFLSLNKYIRNVQASSMSTYYLTEVQKLLQNIKENLDDALFDMGAYLPVDLENNAFGTSESDTSSVDNSTKGTESELPSTSRSKYEETILVPPLEIHERAIASAVLRASECVKEMNFHKLGISGKKAKEVTIRLKDMPYLRDMFDIVFLVAVKKHHSINHLIRDIEEELTLFLQQNRRPGSEEPISFLAQKCNCLLFLDCSDVSVNLHDLELHFSLRFRHLQIVIATELPDAYSIMRIDLEIRTGHHLLPWNLFYRNVGHETMAESHHSLQKIAIRLVEKCHCHLLAIILLARALKNITDVSIWQLALRELTSEHQASSSKEEGISEVMVSVLRFIWPRIGTVSQRCITQCAFSCKGAEFQRSSLISSWISEGFVKSLPEGEATLQDLIRSFLVEKDGENYFRMRDETRMVLLTRFSPHLPLLYLKQEGLKLTEMPRAEEWNARVIHLCDNDFSDLPEKPYCPILVTLDLQLNYNIGVIPLTFFDQMPGIQVLDLSKTSIKYLPPSVSKLVGLREFYMRDCQLLMELPPEIGALKSLRVFDFEGSELIYLPREMGKLNKLEILKVSLCQHAHHFKGSRQISEIIPVAMLSKFYRLKVLSIDVAPDCDWWNIEATRIVEILSDFRNLHTLKFYFPSIELLSRYLETERSEHIQIYPLLSHLRLIVGREERRMISRIPLGLEEIFMKLDKCVKYTDGEGIPNVIAKALKHASAFYLEHNWTIQSLSIFKIDEMENLKFCLLVECNEMKSIINGSEFHEKGDSRGKIYDRRAVLGSLQYLAIHYMKNLECIWRGPFRYGSICCLKTLEIHACPELTMIFTKELLYGLTNLEQLTVEDCAKVNSLVSLGSYYPPLGQFFPKLKRLCLLDLPELINISSGVCIAQELERMVIYNCPMLRGLSTKEVSSTKIEAVNGEIEWWDALEWRGPEWSSGRPDYLASVFIPLARDEGLIEEFTTDGHLLQQLT